MHREIVISENNNNSEGDVDNDISGNNNADNGIYISNSGILSPTATGGGSSTYATGGIGEIVQLNSTENENDSVNTRELVVISVRGSVTPMDWAVDLGNQFNAEHLNFQTGCQEIIGNLT